MQGEAGVSLFQWDMLEDFYRQKLSLVGQTQNTSPRRLPKQVTEPPHLASSPCWGAAALSQDSPRWPNSSPSQSPSDCHIPKVSNLSSTFEHHLSREQRSKNHWVVKSTLNTKHQAGYGYQFWSLVWQGWTSNQQPPSPKGAAHYSNMCSLNPMIYLFPFTSW